MPVLAAPSLAACLAHRSNLPATQALVLCRPPPSPRRKVESFDAEKAGTVELDPSKRDALDADPLARLEHSGEDKRKALATFTQIAALQEDSEAKHK